MRKISDDDADNALRAWYLARARKSALAEQVVLNATPNTLVNADSENLKRIIEVQSRTETAGANAGAGSAIIAAVAAVAVMLLFQYLI